MLKHTLHASSKGNYTHVQPNTCAHTLTHTDSQVFLRLSIILRVHFFSLRPLVSLSVHKSRPLIHTLETQWGEATEFLTLVIKDLKQKEMLLLIEIQPNKEHWM